VEREAHESMIFQQRSAEMTFQSEHGNVEKQVGRMQTPDAMKQYSKQGLPRDSFDTHPEFRLASTALDFRSSRSRCRSNSSAVSPCPPCNGTVLNSMPQAKVPALRSEQCWYHGV